MDVRRPRVSSQRYKAVTYNASDDPSSSAFWVLAHVMEFRGCPELEHCEGLMEVFQGDNIKVISE